MSGEDGPLSFLDRLLEEERHSNLHLGDVRFWKHLEHMDSSHVYRTKSLEYKTMKLMFCEGVFFAMFLFVLTTYLISEKAGDLYSSRRQQLDYWGGCTMQATSRHCKVNDVKDVHSLMTWLVDDFVPLAFTDRTEYPSVVKSPSVYRLQDETPHWTPRYVGDTQTSVLIGTIRMRQVRVQYYKACSILDDLASIVTDCFADFSEAVQSTMSWAPAWTPQHLKDHYDWKSAFLTEQRPIVGRYATYPGDGFVMDLGLNLTGGQTRLQELQSWSWLDDRTRAFIIELNTINPPNVNSFVHSRILFEFPAAGGVLIRQEAFPFRAVQLSLALMAADDFGGSFVYLVLTCGFSLLFAIYNIWLIYKNGARFFTYFWSNVDLLSLVVWAIMLLLKIQIFQVADTLPNLMPEAISDPEMFYPIGTLVPNMELVMGLQALLGLITWLRVMKYLTLSRTFLPFVRIFERCCIALLKYSSLLSVSLFGFAVAIYIGFGTEAGIYNSIWSTFVAVATAPAGGVDLGPVIDKNNSLVAPIILFSYIIVVVLLVLTTFNAIQIDSYSVTTYELLTLKRHKAPGSGGDPTVIFIWTYLNALKGVKLVGKETNEDIGGPEDQVIALSSLPEPVAAKYYHMRRKMEKIRDKAHHQIEDLKKQKLIEAGIGAVGLEDRRERRKSTQSALALEDQEEPDVLDDENEVEEEKMPTSQEMAGIVVNRVQLQRMLDEDPKLVEICSSNKAVDVVRRFKVEQTGDDPFEVVARLQASVAEKLAEIEGMGTDLNFDEVETLRVMSQELHSCLTESQKEWRAELLSVLQLASLLSTALIDLTKKIEQVQLNHTELAIRAAPLTIGRK